VFYRDRRGGVFLFRRGCRNNTVVDNIIVEPAAFRFDAAGSDAPGDQPQGNVLDYNCFAGALSTASSAALRFNRLGIHNLQHPAHRGWAALEHARRRIAQFQLLEPGLPAANLA
jgi:hypothetical protein